MKNILVAFWALGLLAWLNPYFGMQSASQLSGVQILGAQNPKGTLTVYVSTSTKSTYNKVRHYIKADSRRYKKKLVIKTLTELPPKLPAKPSAGAGKILIVAYRSELQKIAPTLANLKKNAKGANITLWVLFKKDKGLQSLSSLPANLASAIAGLDAVSSASAWQAATEMYDDLKIELFR